MSVFHNLLRYKDIILYRTQAGIKSEARQNYLGYVWFLLEPMLSTAVLYFAWTHLTGKTGPDQILMILVGTVAWNGVEPAVMGGSNSIKAKFHVLNQFALPKWLFPIVTILITTWKFLWVSLVVVLLSFALGHSPTRMLLFLPLILIVQLLFVTAVTLPLSILITLINDLNTVVSSIFRLMMFVSGVFFPAKTLPENLQKIFFWNPISVLIESYRAVLLDGQAPNFFLLARAALISCALLLVGFAVHARYDRRILKLTNV